MSRPPVRHLIVGHGQLGRSVSAHLPVGSWAAAEVPWSDPVAARRAIERRLRAFLAGPDVTSVLWCAGAATVGSAPERLDDELASFRTVLDVVADVGRPVRLFVASSAGGVHGGNSGVCDESTPPQPVNAYGWSKLAIEERVAEWAGATNTATVLVGRISNLYGPLQNLAKPQGFISHLLRSMAVGEPLLLRVPPSTIRDFVYAHDVGAAIAGWATHSALGARVDVGLLAAGRSVTLGHVVATAERVTHRRARVLFAGGRDADQPSSIRFRSRAVIPGLSTVAPRPIEHGLWATWSALTAGGRPVR